MYHNKQLEKENKKIYKTKEKQKEKLEEYISYLENISNETGITPLVNGENNITNLIEKEENIVYNSFMRL